MPKTATISIPIIDPEMFFHAWNQVWLVTYERFLRRQDDSVDGAMSIGACLALLAFMRGMDEIDAVTGARLREATCELFGIL